MFVDGVTLERDLRLVRGYFGRAIVSLGTYLLFSVYPISEGSNGFYALAFAGTFRGQGVGLCVRRIVIRFGQSQWFLQVPISFNVLIVVFEILVVGWVVGIHMLFRDYHVEDLVFCQVVVFIMFGHVRVSFFRFMRVTYRSNGLRELRIRLRYCFAFAHGSCGSNLGRKDVSREVFVKYYIRRFSQCKVYAFGGLQVFFGGVALLILGGGYFVEENRRFYLLFCFYFYYVSVDKCFLDEFSYYLRAIPAIIYVDTIVYLNRYVFSVTVWF